MMLTLMLTSKGVAGVPRAALARTCVNVPGNCLAAAVVARWEGVGE
jgi:proton glutamate symport protein